MPTTGKSFDSNYLTGRPRTELSLSLHSIRPHLNRSLSLGPLARRRSLHVRARMQSLISIPAGSTAVNGVSCCRSRIAKTPLELRTYMHFVLRNCFWQSLDMPWITPRSYRDRSGSFVTSKPARFLPQPRLARGIFSTPRRPAELFTSCR